MHASCGFSVLFDYGTQHICIVRVTIYPSIFLESNGKLGAPYECHVCGAPYTRGAILTKHLKDIQLYYITNNILYTLMQNH